MKTPSRDVDEIRLENRAAPGLVLLAGRDRYRILDIGPDSCLIEAPHGGSLRGYADIFHGDLQVAHCLIVVSAAEGNLQRCLFKRRTAARTTPPRDFAL
jgi:hypothetical protein